jgi:hypothetical protein
VLGAEREVSFPPTQASSAGHPGASAWIREHFPVSGRRQPSGGLPEYDVSIILNLHNEARYSEAHHAVAGRSGTQCATVRHHFEIVVVLDNADRATTSLAEAYNYLASSDTTRY